MEITVPLDRFESAEQYVSSNVSTRLALLRDSDVAVGVGPVCSRGSRSPWTWLVVESSPRSPASRCCKSSYFPLNYGSANLCRGHTTSLNACSRVLLADPRTAISGMPGHDGVNNRAAESTDPMLGIVQFILHNKTFYPHCPRADSPQSHSQHSSKRYTYTVHIHIIYIYVYIDG